MSLRTEPVRARSSARVQALLDAAAAVADEVGVEHVTTNLVAERAGCSIGTFYRYFPDRVAVLRALALRHASTLHADSQAALALVAPNAEGLEAALNDIAGRTIERFRSEPGWEAIGFVHSLDTPVTPAETHLVAPPLRGAQTPREQVAHDIAVRFMTTGSQLSELAQHLEVALLILQTLVDRVFAQSKEGDEEVEALARSSFAMVAAKVVAMYRDQQADAAACTNAEPPADDDA